MGRTDTGTKYRKRGHILSPSAWNRFETCPRQFWLSKQRLPRKTSMAAAIGTIVHASIEDIIAENLSGRNPQESGWMPGLANQVLKNRWEEEKEIFFNTPRRPDWKDSEWENARKQQMGGIELLLTKVGASGLELDAITVKLWRQVQRIVLSCEGELRSTDGKLMGRLDLLLAKFDEKGNIIGWVVADLKTGKVPTGALKPTVSRQLRFYRDLLAENNKIHPEITAEGWYTRGPMVVESKGPSVLEDAYNAWEMSQPNDIPFDAKPSNEACGFCDYKAWCPHWWNYKHSSKSPTKNIFIDAVVLLERFDIDRGAALIELCTPKDKSGGILPSGRKFGAIFEGPALESLKKVVKNGWKGALFLGSVKADKNLWRIGNWCDVLPWKPIPDSG
ncbi:MAG: hypothetical protein CMB56_005935 [Methanobacteriota archaeon]|nr:MAG: hypothetical protein CMB56_005935 [Euryarchaeota archaeon]